MGATQAGWAREDWRRLQARALSEVPAAVDAVIAEMVSLGYSGREILNGESPCNRLFGPANLDCELRGRFPNSSRREPSLWDCDG